MDEYIAHYVNISVVVQAGKKSGIILHLGTAPFYYTDDGAIIPNHFLLESNFQGHTILAETRVENDAGFPILSYQFSSASAQVQGGFADNPTKALRLLAEALEIAGRPFDNFDNESGAKHVGVTSACVQRILKAAHEPATSTKRQQQEGGSDTDKEEEEEEEAVNNTAAAEAEEEEEEAAVAEEEEEEAPANSNTVAVVAEEEEEEAPANNNNTAATKEGNEQASTEDTADKAVEVVEVVQAVPAGDLELFNGTLNEYLFNGTGFAMLTNEDFEDAQ